MGFSRVSIQFLRAWMFVVTALVMATAGHSETRIATSGVWGSYVSPASGGFVGKCNECHATNAVGTGAAAVNAVGPLATSLKNDGVNNATPIGDINTKIATFINSTYAPQISNDSFTLSKSAAAGATVGSIPMATAGTRAFRGINTGFSDTYTAQLSSGDARFSISGSGNNWSLNTVGSNPFANVYGSVNVAVTAKNTEGLRNTAGFGDATYTVNLTNNLPAALPTTNFLVAVAGANANFNLSAVDPDGDTLHYGNLVQTTTNGGSATVSDAGLVTFTAPATVAAQYQEDFTVTISNRNGLITVGSQTYTFSVKAVSNTNNTPEALTKTYSNVLEASTVTDATVRIGQDLDSGTSLTYSSGASTLVIGTPFQLAHGTITINASGAFGTYPAANSFTYQGKANDPANDTFAFTVTDNGGKFASGVLTFNKTAVNDPPTVKSSVLDKDKSGTVEKIIKVSDTKPQVTTSIDLKKYVQDIDTPVNQLRYRVIRYVDLDTGVTPASTYGTFAPVSTGEIPQGILTYTNRKKVALDFLVEFRVADGAGAPSATPCTVADPSCGFVRVQVFFNEGGRHTPDQRITLAASLGKRYFKIPGSPEVDGHFPNKEGEGACLNCHTVGKVTSAAPSCNSGFFNAFGARICKFMPFNPDFATRINDATLGTSLNLPSFEPTVTLSQSVVNVTDGAAVGSAVGLPMAFGTGLDLDGKPSKILRAYLAGPAGEFFDIKITNSGAGGGTAAGVLTVKKSLTGFGGGKSIAVKPLPVNDGRRRLNTSGAIANNAPGFYPVLTPVDTLTVNIIREVPKVADDTYQTNIDPAPFEMDVTANDTAGGSIDKIVIVTPPSKGTATVKGTKIVFVSDGTTGADSLTYKAIRNGVGASKTNATVTLAIFDADDAVAQPDGPYNVTVGETIKLPVLANDRGPQPFGDFKIVTAPQLGSAKFVGDQISYKAITAGTDVFEYQVTGGGVTTKASVTVQVGKVSGSILAAATSNPQLKPVARALGDTCRDIERSPDAKSADQVDLASICNALASAAGTKGAIDTALDQIRNEETLVAGDVVMQQDRASGGNILGRLDAVRGGQRRGLSFNQFTLQIDDNTLSGSLVDATIEKASSDELNPDGDKFDLPWGAFVAGTVSVATQKSSDREAGFDLSGLMLTAGVDYAVDDNILLGLAVSFGQSITDIGSTDELVTRSGQVAGYGSFEIADGLFIDGYGGLAFNGFDMSRGIAFTTGGASVERTADSAFDGQTMSAALRLKYDTDIGSANLSTYGTLSYVAAWTDSYLETGAGSLNLAVGEQNFDALTATIGMRLSGAIVTDFAVIKPYVGASYARQLDSDGRSVTSRFAAGLDGSPGFAVTTQSKGDNFGSFELGFAAEFADRTSATVDFAGTLSDGGFEGYSIKAGVSIPLGSPPQPPEQSVTTEPVLNKRKPAVTGKKKPAPDAPSSGDANGGASGGADSGGGEGWQ